MHTYIHTYKAIYEISLISTMAMCTLYNFFNELCIHVYIYIHNSVVLHVHLHTSDFVYYADLKRLYFQKRWK